MTGALITQHRSHFQKQRIGVGNRYDGNVRRRAFAGRFARATLGRQALFALGKYGTERADFGVGRKLDGQIGGGGPLRRNAERRGLGRLLSLTGPGSERVRARVRPARGQGTRGGGRRGASAFGRHVTVAPGMHAAPISLDGSVRGAGVGYADTDVGFILGRVQVVVARQKNESLDVGVSEGRQSFAAVAVAQSQGAVGYSIDAREFFGAGQMVGPGPG